MNKLLILLSGIVFLAIIVYTGGCKPSEAITSKSGAQIWGENCIRCHNAASPSTFSDTEWDVAVMHMQIRANLTLEESEKVAKFLKSAN
jgi:hypothetical protein